MIMSAATLETSPPTDIAVFGAAGSTYEDGVLQLSEDAVRRAEVAASYWWGFHELNEVQQALELGSAALPAAFGRGQMRILCVAGRPGFRQQMGELEDGQNEAQLIREHMLERGVPEEVVRPNDENPLRRAYAMSTVDEVGILIDTGLVRKERYTRKHPLAIVAHRRHGRRIMDVWRKVGFKDEQLRPVEAGIDTWKEIGARAVFQAAVLRGSSKATPDELRQREAQLMRRLRKA